MHQSKRSIKHSFTFCNGKKIGYRGKSTPAIRLSHYHISTGRTLFKIFLLWQYYRADRGYFGI